ncbi:dynamin-related protein 4C-like isoform X1 [Brassica napus]|uniref:dynamin-related protein 4C-like isoform X1 n=1 Tax=Brassica napus TaxID=3708 RepID=UPI00207AD236|nr:dynamin-related protein 4C-like isoform X1 [Brassica napus]XP_048616566.1 dynamin-related protein 4C-like isoform X1 [Brassica napus]XP_048616567.1 dynamin-related protein 4C-like isoform X1 [Brassica napus]XP_048616568.1 dynamin-related protein 4C-like isoform X1 [Brassica napus]
MIFSTISLAGLGSVILEKSTMKTLTIYGKSGSPVDHMSCFGDVARRFQETDLDEATKGKQYIHSCLRFFFLNSEVFLHCLRIHSGADPCKFFSPLVSMTNYLDRSLDDLKLYHAHLLQKAFGMKMRIAAYWPIVLQRIIDSISMHLHLSVNYLVNSRFQTEIIAEMVDFGGGGRVERMLRGDEQEKEIMKSRIGLLKDSVEVV